MEKAPLKKRDPGDQIALDFIDPFFATVIGISLAQIYNSPCFQLRYVGICLTHGTTVFHLLTLLLGYLTVIWSWIGYHLSVRKHQIVITHRFGAWRFWLDIALLISYLFLLVKYQHFLVVMILLALIFLVFGAWDQCKFKEYEHEFKDGSQQGIDAAQRRGVTALWAILFVILMIVAWIHESSGSPGLKDWIVLVLAIIFTFAYRRQKEFAARILPPGRWWYRCLTWHI